MAPTIQVSRPRGPWRRFHVASWTVVTAASAVTRTASAVSRPRRQRRARLESAGASAASNATHPHFTAGDGNQRCASAQAISTVQGTSTSASAWISTPGRRSSVCGAEAQQPAAREGAQHVDHRRDARLPRRVRDEDGRPGLRPQLGLERLDAAKVVKRQPGAAREPQPRTERAGQRREPQRDVAAVLAGGGAHRRVDQQLGGAVRRVGQPQQILDEPARAARTRAPCSGTRPAWSPGRRRRSGARRSRCPGASGPGSPSGGIGWAACQRAISWSTSRRGLTVGLGEQARIERADLDPLGAGAPDLRAQAGRGRQRAIPVARIPDRLLADAHGGEGRAGGEPLLGAEEAGAPSVRGGGRHEPLRGHRNEVRRARSAPPAATQARPVSMYATQASSRRRTSSETRAPGSETRSRSSRVAAAGRARAGLRRILLAWATRSCRWGRWDFPGRPAIRSSPACTTSTATRPATTSWARSGRWTGATWARTSRGATAGACTTGSPCPGFRRTRTAGSRR